MSESTPLDVLIIGAGPTGLSLAGDLIRHGMKVRIVDRAEQPTDLSKAVVLMPRTLEEFAPRGLAEDAISRGEPAISLSTYSNGHLIFYSVYDHLATDYSFLINIPQAETETVLRGYLEKQGGQVEWNTELVEFTEDGDGITATLRLPDGSTEQVRAHYLAGCDGAHSLVRHTLGFEFHGASYRDTWRLADVKIDWRFPHGHTYLFFLENGLFAVFPMPGERYRIYVVEPLEKQLGRAPTLDEFQALADRFVPDGCTLSDSHWLSEFHCHHRKVKHYSRGRVFLAGDSAHVHSPETGLGMNTGIQDAFNLAWKIAWVRKGWAKPALLDTYDLERSLVGKQVVALSDLTHKLWAQFGALAQAIREPMWRFFSGYYAHHTEKLEEAVQIRIHYPPSLCAVTHGRPDPAHANIPAVEAGMRVINAELQPAAGTAAGRTTVYDLLDASGFRLMILAGAHPSSGPQIPAADLQRKRQDAASTLSSLRVQQVEALLEAVNPYRGQIKPFIVYGGQDAAEYTRLDAPVYIDPTLQLHFRYAAQRGAVFLMRPDLYMGYVTYHLEVEPLRKFLRGLFEEVSRQD